MSTQDFRDHFAEVDPDIKSRRGDLWARLRFAPPLASIAPFGTSPRNVRYLRIGVMHCVGFAAAIPQAVTEALSRER